MIQQWAVSADGGFFAVPDLSLKLLAASQQRAVMRQFTIPMEAFGKGKGDTMYYDRRGNVASAGSTSGILESQPMPQTTFALTQGSIVTNEYGNSVRYTGKLLDIGTISVSEAAENALRDDMVKTLDLAVRVVIRSTDIKIKYSCTGTAGAPTSTFGTAGAGVAYTREGQPFDVREVIGYLDNTLFAPPYEGTTWVCLTARDGFNRAVFDGSNFQDVAIRQKNGDLIFKGEVGEYYSTRFVTETNAFSTKLNTYRGEFAFLGQEALYEAVAIAPHIRAKEITDFGRDRGLSWYAIWGVNECWDTSTAGEHTGLARSKSGELLEFPNVKSRAISSQARSGLKSARRFRDYAGGTQTIIPRTSARHADEGFALAA